jgi:hypothetical protein
LCSSMIVYTIRLSGASVFFYENEAFLQSIPDTFISPWRILKHNTVHKVRHYKTSEPTFNWSDLPLEDDEELDFIRLDGVSYQKQGGCC